MDSSTRTDRTADRGSDAVTRVGGAVLYQVGITPSSRKVRMFLAEKHLSLEMQDVTDGFGLSRSYMARYP
ncbi:MAG TPA: glutathione S-transferase N-terminal domain-containing protein, partial [Burkholderiales bacterium]